MTTRHKHADLIIAWANGAKIQWKQFEPFWTGCFVRWITDWIEVEV